MTFRLQVFAARGCLGRLRHAVQPVIVDFGAGAIVTLLTASSAWAAGSGMPWEAPLERILESVQGPVAKIVAVRGKSEARWMPV